MEKYTRARMEVIEFDAEDVITTSSCINVNSCSCNGGASLYDSIGFACPTEVCDNPR